MAISIQTANNKTIPLIIFCQEESKPIMLIPLFKLAIIKEPNKAPNIAPVPPLKLMPPITHAAMASSSLFNPVDGTADANLAVFIIPAKAAIIPFTVNTKNIYFNNKVLSIIQTRSCNQIDYIQIAVFHRIH